MTKSTKAEASKESGVPTMMAAMMAVSPAATKAWLDVVNESNRFVADRVQQDLETQKSMLRCKNPAEFLHLQSEFYREAVLQYSNEAIRLFQMVSDATEQTVKEAKSGHSREYDDIPL